MILGWRAAPTHPASDFPDAPPAPSPVRDRLRPRPDGSKGRELTAKSEGCEGSFPAGSEGEVLAVRSVAGPSSGGLTNDDRLATHNLLMMDWPPPPSERLPRCPRSPVAPTRSDAASPGWPERQGAGDEGQRQEGHAPGSPRAGGGSVLPRCPSPLGSTWEASSSTTIGRRRRDGGDLQVG